VISNLTWVLQKFSGDPGLPSPDRLVRASWSTDPHSMGSLCYPALISEEEDFCTLSAPLPSETDPRLLFAGDATHATFWGTMHGARLSGIREAKRVLDRVTAVDRIVKELDKIANVSDWIFHNNNEKKK
jgi:monoamine oxidase